MITHSKTDIPSPSSRPGHFTPRFGENMPDPTRISEMNRQTLNNANKLSEQYLSFNAQPAQSQEASHERIKNTKDQIHKHLFDPSQGVLTGLFLLGISFFGGLGSLAGWGAVRNHHYIQTHTTSVSESENNKNLKLIYTDQMASAKGQRVLFSLLALGGCGLVGIVLGLEGHQFAKELIALRKALKASQKLDQKVMNLEPPIHETDKSIVASLKNWINQEAFEFSKNIKDAYNTEPEIQPQLNAIFGSKDKLPDTQAIQKLFQYYTFLSFLDEKKGGSAQKQSSPHKITELEFLQKEYALVKTGNQLGELFQFVSPATQKDPYFQQQLNKNIAWQTLQTQEALERRLQTLRDLHNNKIEADRHIGLAQQALLSAKLSKDTGKTTEIRKLVEDFKDQKEKIQESIEKVDQGILEDTHLLEGLNENFNHSVAYLQAVMESKKIELSATESIQNLLKQKNSSPHTQTNVD